MKRNDWLLIFATLSYSLLFYKQAQGINYLIFDCIIVLCLGLQERATMRKAQFLTSAAACILAGVSVAIFGNSLSLVTNIISLVLVSGIVITPGSSVIVRIMFGIYSLAGSPGFMILDHMERKEKSANDTTGKRSRNYLIALIPIVAVLIFFLLYRSTSPVFAKFTDQIDFSFISVGWIFFTLLGFILVYGLLNPHNAAEVARYDVEYPQTAINSEKTISLFGRKFTIDEENLSGIALLATLNALLLIVNGLDLGFFFTGAIPEGMTLSEYVHQGTTALIFSIIIAIAIIMVYLRGALNYYKDNRKLRTLAYLWVFQNIIIVGSTAYRNWLYIQEYSLTYKRIGVYVFLLMACIGLLTTIVKIGGRKSNYFLLRINSKLFYTALLISSFITWDNIIADFNLSKAKEGKTVDPFYLMELSNAVVPQVYDYYLEHGKEMDEGSRVRLNRELSAKIYLLYRKEKGTGWQSYMLMDHWVLDKLKRKSAEGKITEFDLSGRVLIRPKYLQDVPNLKTLKLNYTAVDDYQALADFKQLEHLQLNNVPEFLPQMLPTIPTLKEFSIRWNNCGSLKNVAAQPELRKLDVSRNSLNNLEGINKFPKLEELNVCINRLESIEHLEDVKTLKKLYHSSHELDLSNFKSQRADVQLIPYNSKP